MSEVRPVFASWRFADIRGKKSLRIELFRAREWRSGYRPIKRNTIPRPPIRPNMANAYWNSLYRLRIDGRWHRPGKERYAFYTMQEAAGIAEEMINGQ